jgi:serine/threonine protein kinase
LPTNSAFSGGTRFAWYRSTEMAGLVRKGKTNEGGGIRLVPGLAVRAGQTLAGKYRVEELVGRGPSGVVISARNVHLREQVSLKILASYTDDQDQLVKRRLKKARIASGLKSKHVARIVDIGFTEDGMPYVATEALEGNTLEAELAERGALPTEEAARWVLEACEGLAEAHASGLVHGDLKPQNIFLALPTPSKRGEGGESVSLAEGDEPTDGEARVLKILDFGSTSPLDAIGDQSASAFFGSPAFVAPEQIQTPTEVDARADVWALGVLLYNLVSGRLPFEADTLSGVIVAVVYDAPGLLTDAPYELARLVHRCLEKDPAKRPQDVRELAEALAPFAGSSGARASERVSAMLDAGSISPVALSAAAGDDVLTGDAETELPLPLVTERAEAIRVTGDQPTRPSQRVTARRRRSHSRAAAIAVFGGAAAIALAAWSTLPLTSPALATMAPAEVSITSAPMAVALATEVPVTRAAALPDAPDSVVPPPLPAPVMAEVSFAASSTEGITPTPLAVTATPLATSEPFPPPSTLPFPSPDEPPGPPTPLPPQPAPVVLPAPHTVTPASLPNAPSTSPRPRMTSATQRSLISATTPMRLPPGLPTSRDGRSDRSDETNLRKLLTDRK